MQLLTILFHYFNGYQNSKDKRGITAAEVIQEVNRCLALSHSCSNTAFLWRLECRLLPWGNQDGNFDILFQSHIKNNIAKINYGNRLDNLYINLIANKISYKVIRFILKQIDSNNDNQIDAIYDLIYYFPDSISSENCFKKTSLLMVFLSHPNIHFSYKDIHYLKSFKEMFTLDDIDYSKLLTLDEKNNISINKSYFAEITEKIYPFYTMMQKKYAKELEENNSSFYLQTCENQELLNRYLALVTESQISADVNIPTTTLKAFLASNFWITITLFHNKYINIYYDRRKGRVICKGVYQKNKQNFKIDIAPNLKLFTKDLKGHCYPISIQRAKKEAMNCPSFKELLSMIENQLVDKSLFYKDIIEDSKYGFLVPLSYNNAINYHNRKEFLISNYKLAASLSIQ